ncbi:hypothetical protein DFJ63DRAFT_312842 [Scheffersomyces coipomensis]|uniref:uncharacterized protein n=1 Tax=Scheffersomyces coipomensis TaxID=1788519 RepID=UPI00315DE6AF
MASIKQINHNDITKLTSGQVIIDLKSIIKELVENSIDANSSNIEIIFHNYGLESIQINDNGNGIEEENFHQLCLRSHTSKLIEFNDLHSLTSLGFRGEALNSICSICKSSLEINTKFKSSIYQFELEYNQLGELIKSSKKPTSIKSGTTIILHQLFQNLPVRFKNFEKNLKLEFNKCIKFLINYLLIYPHIKFTIFNVVNSKKNLILNTKGGLNNSSIDNLINIFGNNLNLQFKNLLPLNDLIINDHLKLQGYISSSSIGSGLAMANNDKQFIFINSRPIINKKFIKLINEIYKSFNFLQFPIFMINLIIDPNELDINLVPDKTMILIHNELEIFELIREKLSQFFENQNNLIPKNKSLMKDTEFDQIDKKVETIRTKKELAVTKQEPKETEHEEAYEEEDEEEVREEADDQEDNNEVEVEESAEQEDDESELEDVEAEINENNDNDNSNSNDNETLPFDQTNNKRKLSEVFQVEEITFENDDIQVSSRDISRISHRTPPSSARNSSPPTLHEHDKIECNHDHNKDDDDNYGKNFYPIETDDDKVEIKIGDKIIEEPPIKKLKTDDIYNLTYKLDVEDIHDSLKQFKSLNLINEQQSKDTSNDIKIDNIEENQEEKLSYIISKQDFLNMKLIGQFNLGFILVSLNDQKNLFIIDQHASDEKFNFERLQNEIKINYQNLIQSIKLEINIIDELLIIEHQKVFELNGFKFIINEDNKPGFRIELKTLPIFKGILFNLNDFFELLNLINLNPNNKSIKCSKIRNILASKACRSSIMIGQSLHKSRMNQIIKNLNTLDKPWNCPHGRPTMRHLIELNNWKLNLKDYEL